jgi:hypothetical protein
MDAIEKLSSLPVNTEEDCNDDGEITSLAKRVVDTLLSDEIK